VSILLGIAMDRGLLPGLEEGVLDFRLPELFPEYGDVLDGDSGKANIRLRHILSMSAGLAWDEESHPYNDPRNDWVRVRSQRDPVRLVLQQPVAGEPGEMFNYSGGLSTLLGYLLERDAGMEATDFAERYLFGPLGISDYVWWDLAEGLIDAPGGLNLRPRDMAKLGQLFLNGGTWKGQRIVSREWVEVSTRTQIEIDRSPDYAFQWWCGDFYYQGRNVFVYMASGLGGQKIFVVPDMDLVAVLTHQVFDNPAGELHNTSIMSRYILPAADALGLHDQVTVMDAAALTPYTGAFATVSNSTDRFTIDLRDSKLYATAPDTPVIELIPVTPTWFRGTVLNFLDVDFFFDVTADGQVTGGRTADGFRSDPFVREGR
jgi:CubicO group peptidase (beta-lactamase class C family)